MRESVLSPWGTEVTKSDILALSTNCKKLSSLDIPLCYVESSLAPIWRSLGSTLTRIRIRWYNQHSAARYQLADIIAAPDLVEHCVNLRHVDVEQLNQAVANALIALGSRIRVLRIASIPDPDIALCCKVYRACTNLEAVHLGLDCSVQAISVLSLMRTKLVSFKLFVTGNLIYLYNLQNLHDLLNLPPTEEHFLCSISLFGIERSHTQYMPFASRGTTQIVRKP